MHPSEFERFVRGDGKRFHVRSNPQRDRFGWEVYGPGLDIVAVCVSNERANMIAAALELAADLSDSAQGQEV